MKPPGVPGGLGSPERQIPAAGTYV